MAKGEVIVLFLAVFLIAAWGLGLANIIARHDKKLPVGLIIGIILVVAGIPLGIWLASL